jgi:AcrR family transcriptional regulator
MTAARDRALTETKILDAAEKIMAREGFAALTVSAIAETAGVDRKLVYRYFGGADGVAERLGANAARWLGEADIHDGGRAAAFDDYAASLRADKALQQMLAWELVESSPLLKKLDRARSAAMQKRFAWLKPAAKKDPRDTAAENAIALAALHYLALRERTMEGFAGLKLDEAGWTRIRAVLHKLLRD